MKNTQRILCVLFSLLLLLCIPSFCFAADKVTDDGFHYDVIDADKKTVQITGYSGTKFTLKIPDKIDGYTVTTLKSEAFKKNLKLLSVTVPDTVKTIGSECFAECTTLGSVELGKAVSAIGAKAFSGCILLSAMSIPATCSAIGDNAFYNCPILPRIEVASANETYKSVDGILYNKAGTKLIVYPSAHAGSTYNVPSGVTQIEDNAFYSSKTLKTVTVPDSVSAFGTAIFKNCSALTTVTLPNGMKKIEEEMFSGCKKLSSLSFPTTVTTIGANAFKGCASIPSLKIPSGVTTVENGAFTDCTALKNVTIGDNVSSLTGSAFTGCTALTEFKIEKNTAFTVTDGVLFNKNGTKLICYPAGKTDAEYTIGKDVTSIGENAFCNCKHLKKLTVPASVETLADSAVVGCDKTLVILADENSPAYNHFKAHTGGYLSLNNEGLAKPGDINGDEQIDNADVILIRRYVAGWKDIKIDKDAADVNNDNAVDNADVILLRRYVAGWKNVTLK